MRRIRRLLLGFAFINVAFVLIARLVIRPRIPSFGGPEDDSVRLAAITDGIEFVSHAGALRDMEAIAIMGGIQVDLRNATLADGATLRITAAMGGVQVYVPEKWKVRVTSHVVAGGVDADVTPAEHLPPENPTLMVDVRAYMGGVEIKAQ
ncbi:MAG: cell wall-active antibiotics response protein [Acidimicrobiia bacterium]|nr:cell wall-active antibiotics response protein [Acidimicrobiia bacterium]